MRPLTSTAPGKRGANTQAVWPRASSPRRSVSTEGVTPPRNGRELLGKGATFTAGSSSRLVELLEVLRLDVLQPLPQTVGIVGLDRLAFLSALGVLPLSNALF